MKALMMAIKGALDNYETPDSPEGLDAALRLLRSEYELAEIRADMIRRKQSEAGKTTKRRLTKKDARAMAKLSWAAGVRSEEPSAAEEKYNAELSDSRPL